METSWGSMVAPCCPNRFGAAGGMSYGFVKLSIQLLMAWL